MEIVKANTYDGRTVITVCENPDDPEYIGADGSLTKPDLTPWGNEDGAVYYHTHHELIFEGEDLYTTGSQGERRRKTGPELLEDVKARLAPAPKPVTEPDLEGRVF